MSISDTSNFATPDPHVDFEMGFGWKFGPSISDAIGESNQPHPSPESDWITSPFAEISEISMFRKPLWRCVERLYLAALLADDCDCKRPEFSVSLKSLSQMGLRKEELKWLLIKNLVSETDRLPEDLKPNANRTSHAQLSLDALFVITDFGIELVEENMTAAALRQSSEGSREADPTVAQAEVKPSWDGERHELRCAGKVVKKFKWRAANQETILAAFEEQSWQARIDDPLPRQSDIDPKRRLADAIKSLNRHQKYSLVRFCGDGTGEGVLWEYK